MLPRHRYIFRKYKVSASDAALSTNRTHDLGSDDSSDDNGWWLITPHARGEEITDFHEDDSLSARMQTL